VSFFSDPFTVAEAPTASDRIRWTDDEINQLATEWVGLDICSRQP
jgi:hypothetical protein